MKTKDRLCCITLFSMATTFVVLLSRHRFEEKRMPLDNVKLISLFPVVKKHTIVLADEQQNTLGVFEEESINTFKMMTENIDYLIRPKRMEFNCTKIFQGNESEIKRVEHYIRKYPYPSVPEMSFVKATQNCDHFKRVRGYVTEVSDVEREFPIAYSIVLHKFADQTERLLRAIYRPSNYYCLHVDKKADLNYFKAVKAVVGCFDNVFVASKRETVVYAGFSRLQADINCMEELFAKYKDWKYLLNYAGTEFPLKSNKELVQLLKVYNGINIVQKTSSSDGLTWRWKRYYENTVSASGIPTISWVKGTVSPPPCNLTMVKGSAYVGLSRAFIGYVLHDSVPQEFLKWNRHTYSPDEHFWATLNSREHNPHLKSPGANSIPQVNYMSRAVLWGSNSCRGKNVRAVCEFGVGNLPWLRSRSEFIANKFNVHVDDVALTCMEELLSERATQDKPWDLALHQGFLAIYAGLHR